MRRPAAAAGPTAAAPAAAPGLAGAELRTAQKELAALERRLEKLEGQITTARTALADHDQSDYAGIGAEMTRIGAARGRARQPEARWFELSELLG